VYREYISPDSLTELLASRLVPLDKCPGVRPIGIGEVLRRIIGKCVIEVIKDDIMAACGTLQTCGGVKSGIEAAIHAMADQFAEERTEGLLLVDATNAFNCVNREMALDSVAERCPVFHQFLFNTYQAPTKLYLNGSKKGEFIWGEEGNTQGNVAAMPFYGIATMPIIEDLITNCETTQVWYADDSSAADTLVSLLKWWNRLNEIGPQYGYFPKAEKTVLIVKHPEHLTRAKELFGSLGVKVTSEGQRHLGAIIGSSSHKRVYMERKLEKWLEDLEELSIIAENEPQLAYCSFTKGICHRWTYFMRTIPEISEFLAPLELKITECFIPALLGRCVTAFEREILELPVRYGGLGIVNPAKTCERESINVPEKSLNLLSN
jgi:hypothetical protein